MVDDPSPSRLVAKPLSEDDRVWLGLFSAGDDWWERELRDHLSGDALEQWRAGYNTTTLFTEPGSPNIVAFLTGSVGHWSNDKTQQTFPGWDPIPALPPRIPVMLVPYFAVARKHQGQGYGSEIFADFLESLLVQHGAPRFIYLQVWAENEGAVRFYQKFDFEEFDRKEFGRPDGAGKAVRLSMAYDRFLIRDD